MTIRPYDRDQLRESFQNASPFPHVMIEGFLEDDFARAVAEAYPSFDDAAKLGRQFSAVNEAGKIQIT